MLSVRDLVVEFDSPYGRQRALHGVTFEVRANEVFCLVGESGSGKSVTSLAVMGLLPRSARIVEGEILFQGRDLRKASGAEMRQIRGKELAMIFQDPMTSMNPVIRVGKQIGEMVHLHEPDLSREAVHARVVELMSDVKIPNARGRYASYPHELSGGTRQRAMIAMAMAHNPALLIADEPTTALDVTIQAQVLDLLADLRAAKGSALMLITHDLGVVAETADRVAVMYAGSIVETGSVEEIFYSPKHPYTVGLLASLLGAEDEREVAYAIPGQPPTPARRPTGCPFHPRCGLRRGRELCKAERPQLVDSDSGQHPAACHFSAEVAEWVRVDFPELDAARPGGADDPEAYAPPALTPKHEATP
jgi:oligopeptide/dipeptide ABC transporter ATP-binding protein